MESEGDVIRNATMVMLFCDLKKEVGKREIENLCTKKMANKFGTWVRSDMFV